MFVLGGESVVLSPFFCSNVSGGYVMDAMIFRADGTIVRSENPLVTKAHLRKLCNKVG